MYDSAEEAMNRLNGCIVLHNKVPLWVIDARRGEGEGAEIEVRVNEIDGGGRRKWIKLNDLTYKKYPVGFINHDGKASYLIRKALRGAGYRQGLNNANTMITMIKREGQVPIRLNDLCRNKEPLTNMFQRKYPKLNECIKTVASGEAESMAFCKEFAVTFDPLEFFVLHHKTDRVAVSTDGERFKLPNQYKYLREAMDERNIKVI